MKIRILTISIVLLIGLEACKKAAEIPVTNISGEWYQQIKRVDNLVNRENFNFKPNQTVEITLSVVDTVAKEVKGYTRRQMGTYSFKGDSLILEDLKFYMARSYTYIKLEELEYINTRKRESYKVIYNSNMDLLTLKFNCPPNANCIPHPKLTRLKP